MRKTIAMYWPLALVIGLAAAAYLHVCSDAAARGPQAPLAADQLSAELARAVSYGMIDDASSPAVKPLREIPALPLMQAS
ncbi:hypothetical protein [Burkholderia sp. WSM2232]|uniref:hypothetical protein n=1 Tax=Burkholderia sp. WSM2232 TaxID=944436 RepID=UPI00042A69AD|nr:hypothetical protein [Burkholderia sp. WSM2232]